VWGGGALCCRSWGGILHSIIQCWGGVAGLCGKLSTAWQQAFIWAHGQPALTARFAYDSRACCCGVPVACWNCASCLN
jgi:hypothetical protein